MIYILNTVKNKHLLFVVSIPSGVGWMSNPRTIDLDVNRKFICMMGPYFL